MKDILLSFSEARHARRTRLEEEDAEDLDESTEDAGEAGEADDGRVYKNPRNLPSALCPRDEQQAALLVSLTKPSVSLRNTSGGHGNILLDT